MDRENRLRETAALSERGMTKAIVGGALVSIHQDVVGFAQFLEFLFGVWVVRILIGMKLDGQFAVGALDLLPGRRCAQHPALRSNRALSSPFSRDVLAVTVRSARSTSIKVRA